jgi:hypothetical protein
VASLAVLMFVMTGVSITIMTARRITANLPAGLLQEAMEVTGKGITETLIEGLTRVRRSRAYRKALALKGRLAIIVDLETSRERRRR